MEKTNLGFLDRFDNFSKELQKQSKKDKKGFGYRYMPLDELLNLAYDIGKKHKITFVQYMDYENGKEFVISKLVDLVSRKNVLKSKKAVYTDTSNGKNEAQSNGSAITYARRYDLWTIFRILPEEDKDGVVEKPKKNQNFKPKTSKKFTSETTLDLTPPDHML